MIFSRHIYWAILLRILLILATSGTGLWLIISQRGIIIGTLLIICSLFQIGGIVTYLNNINRKLRLFFDAIEDRDNTFSYPEQGINEEQQQLNRSLNRINALLAQTKMDYQKQEHFYRSLLEKVPNGIIAWNNSKKIIFVNNTALTLLNIESLTLYSQLENILQNEKNRKRLSLSQSQMKLQDETITLLSIQDIDDRLNENESESWSKLSHVLTHEIMNSVTPITSLSDTLLSMVEDKDEEISHGLQTISATGKGLLAFVESYRKFTRIPTPEPSLFYLKAFIERMVELARHQNPCDHITFHTKIDPADLILHADENLISQVVINLLKNAIQAIDTQADGKIEIQGRCNAAEEVLIEIKNNGPAIPSDIADHIFIPFFTTKSEGSGIGLSLCKQIIRLHDGHLTIQESNPGKTIFHIDMPL